MLIQQMTYAGGQRVELTPVSPPYPCPLQMSGPLNHAFLREQMELRRTPYRLGFKSKFATPMALYTNYASEELGEWVEEEEDE